MNSVTLPAVWIDCPDSGFRNKIIKDLTETSICKGSEHVISGQNVHYGGMKILCGAVFPEITSVPTVFIVSDETDPINFMESEATWLLKSEVNSLSLERSIRYVLRSARQTEMEIPSIDEETADFMANEDDKVPVCMNACKCNEKMKSLQHAELIRVGGDPALLFTQDAFGNYKLPDLFKSRRRIRIAEFNPGFRTSGMLRSLIKNASEKKTFLHSLILREKKYRSLVEHGADMLCMFNSDLSLQYCSNSVERITGFKFAELKKKNFIGLLENEHKRAFEKELFNALHSENETGCFQVSIPYKDGESHWIEGTIKNLLNDQAIRAIVVSFRDVTVKKQVEEMVASSQVNLQLLLDNTEESFVMLDLAKRILTYNKKAEMFGSLAGLWQLKTGANFEDVVSHQYQLRFRETFPRVIQGNAFTFENTFTFIDGSELALSCTLKPCFCNNGEVRAVMLITRDITVNRKFQHDLIISENRFRSLIENIGDSIIVIDGSNQITFASDSNVRMLGYSLGELLNMTPADLIHPDDEVILNNCLQVLKGLPGKTIWTRIRTRKADGSVFWWEGSLTNLLHRESIKGIVLNFRDITDRLNAERQIEFDRNNRDALINNTKDLLWSVDSQMRLITANNAFKEQILAQTGRMIIPGDYAIIPGSGKKDFFWEKLYKRAFKGESFSVESFSSIPQKIATEISFNPIKENGVVIGVACSSRDISERKNAELKLQESYAERRNAATRLTTILNTLPAHVAMLDEEGVIVDVNESWKYFSAESTLINASFDIGDNYIRGCEQLWSDFSDDGKIIARAIREILAGKKEQFTHEYTTDPFENKKWFRVHIKGLNDSTQRGAVVMHLNISDRKEAERRISSSEALFKAIVTNSLHVVQLIDINGKISYTSPSVKLVLGFSEFDMDTNHLSSFIHPEDQQQFRDHLDSLDPHLTPSPLFVRILNHRNVWVWTEMQLINLLHDKDVNSIVVNYRDVTGRVNAEAKLKASNNELQTFIYKASHDLRGPLASIIGLTRIGKSAQQDTRNSQIMQMIEASANKLDGALMKLVQSMTIKDATRFHDVIDFEDIIHEALTKYEFYPGFSKIRATVVVNKNYELTSNRLIIQSIVQNLIENAIKYQNPHVESFLHIQVGGTDNEAVLVFEDNGIGIEKSIQEKVFEMYFRGTQKSNGSGLGLYLVKTGIDKLGGNISIMSEPGVGSTFIITLPTIQNEIAHR